jgi:hypothetical protein
MRRDKKIVIARKKTAAVSLLTKNMPRLTLVS